MAFNIQGLSLSSYSTNEAAPSIHTYISLEDTLTSIIANNNYFGAIAAELSVNDLFYICDSTGLPNGKSFYYVANIDVFHKQVIFSTFGNQAGPVNNTISVDVNTFQAGRRNIVVAAGYEDTTLTATIPGAIIGQIYLISFSLGMGGALPNTIPQIQETINNSNLQPNGIITPAFYVMKIIAANTIELYPTVTDAISETNVYTITDHGNNAFINLPYALSANFGYETINTIDSTVTLELPAATAAMQPGDTIHVSNTNGGNVYIFQNPGQTVIIGSTTFPVSTGYGMTNSTNGIVSANILFINTAATSFDLVVLSNVPGADWGNTINTSNPGYPTGGTIFNLVNAVNITPLQYL